jgi:spectinomycin phosphotransferase
VPAHLPPRDDLIVPRRDTALDDLDTPWTGGPYGESARALVRANREAIVERFARYDGLVPTVAAGAADWVVTHGEPHAGNVMWARDGGLRLIDWDTVALAPPERDLWLVGPRDADDWAAYGRSSAADPAAMELYRLRWELTDLCSYIATLKGPHADDEDTRIASRALAGYLDGSGSGV